MFTELTADSITSKITELIEYEQDLSVSRHVKLTQYLNELSVIGFPP